jgi:hypothetical protein
MVGPLGGIDFASFCDFSIKLCDFWTVMTVWYFLFFIFINCTLKDRLNEKLR